MRARTTLHELAEIHRLTRELETLDALRHEIAATRRRAVARLAYAERRRRVLGQRRTAAYRARKRAA